MGDDRPIRYTEQLDDGRVQVVYRASSLGGCPRAFVAAASGMTPRPHPEWFQEVLDEGHAAEQQIIDMWVAAGGEYDEGSSQREFELVVVDDDETRIVVRAHADGTDSEGIIECKKFRDSTWPKFLSSGVEVSKLYPWQVSAMMHAWQRESGEHEYPMVKMIGGHWQALEDGGEGVGEISVHFITNPPIPMRAIKQKIAKLESMIDEGFAPTDPEVPCAEDSYPCPYWYLHPTQLAGGKQDKPVPVKLRHVPDDIQRMLSEDVSYRTQLKMLEDDAKKIKAKRDEARAKLTTWLAEQGVKPGGSAIGAGYVIEHTRREVKGYEVKPRVDEYLTVKFDKTDKTDETGEKSKSKRKSKDETDMGEDT